MNLSIKSLLVCLSSVSNASKRDDSVFFFVQQKTAYERRISHWSSDVCSSDLAIVANAASAPHLEFPVTKLGDGNGRSEERRVGKECVSTCRSRWSPYL